jgi:hypothetical protein
MEFNAEKIMGYSLLGVGLIIMLGAIISLYSMVTGSSLPPDIFALPNITASIPIQGSTTTMQLMTGAVASKFANMAVWYMFMAFLTHAGSKIAGLGVHFLREIKFTLKE